MALDYNFPAEQRSTNENSQLFRWNRPS